MHLALLGSFGSIAFHFRYDVNLHGGANGLDSRGIGEFTIGSGLRLFEGSELFYRAGVAGASLRNDEVRATLNELPAVQLGYQLKTKDILFEIGPEGALALGTEWEPGDEDQGRRLRRKLKSAFGAGGFGSVSIHHFILQGKALHLFDADPLLVADGQLCFAYGLAICGFGQYWKADARNPISGEIRSAEATYFGLALGVGIAGETAWAQRK
jgi:hypothetical protein